MKRVIAVGMVLVASMALSTKATADDAADVKAAVLRLNEASNSGDVDTMAQYLGQGRSLFNLSGRLLSVSEGYDKDAARAAFEAGRKYNRTWRHLDVKTYGDAAVVTGYHVGSNTAPNGSIFRGTRRVTEVWIKQGGQCQATVA